MDEAEVAALQEAIQRMEDCASILLETVPVSVVSDGAIVWQGEVSVFKLTGHPAGARKCYAWASPVAGSDRRSYTVVLHWPPVESPQSAVQTVLARERRTPRE